ncbi:MAG: peroxidase family protein [Planctomycetota bacterium]
MSHAFVLKARDNTSSHSRCAGEPQSARRRASHLPIIRCLIVACAMCCPRLAAEYRTYDGSGNNFIFPTAGAAGERVVRFGYEADYPDQIGDVITRAGKPNPRDVSNAVFAQPVSKVNARGLSDWVVHWGQFLTHDMSLIRNDDPYNVLSTGQVGDFRIPITNPTDPLGPGFIPFNRSEFDPTSGDGSMELTPAGMQFVPRWQINRSTSYIDASNVYGSGEVSALSLRTMSGGRLQTSANGSLPATDQHGFFVAGDERANENVGLTSIHALFVREHNRLANAIANQDSSLSDEEIYQRARRIVGAEMQAITYNEFLPALLGVSAPAAEDYTYLLDDASITLAFSTAAFRFGHSMQSPELALVFPDGTTAGNIDLTQASRNPGLLSGNPELVDQLLKGMASQRAQENDAQMVDPLRNQLLGPPGMGVPLDLASLDIQRGRDHGLLNSYNQTRISYSLPPLNSFAALTSDPALQAQLASVYGHVDNVDMWVGILSEDHLPGSSMGALGTSILRSQFLRLRDGDRFFFTGDGFFDDPFIASLVDLEAHTLNQIIEFNTGMAIQDNVFFVVPEPNATWIAIVGLLFAFKKHRENPCTNDLDC